MAAHFGPAGTKRSRSGSLREAGGDRFQTEHHQYRKLRTLQIGTCLNSTLSWSYSRTRESAR